MHRRRRVVVAAAVVIGMAAAVAGCAPQGRSLSAEFPSDASAGYVSQDGTVVQVPAQDRGEPVSFTGKTEHGDNVSSKDFTGRVYVVNFWYAACGPCRVEAPMLEEAWQTHKSDDVGFLGVNIYDQAPTALAFAKDYGITYPSVIDVNDGDVKLAFAAATPIQATPTTLVIDTQGRVAARIIGQLESAALLSSLIQSVLDEAP
ncbi:TlpA disulfide reductase family protein [Microbacterium sp. NPDC080220]|uniref:TlpA family protein disulfide reductase n=1 Tax=Microbacterium sp. NPDC080220 TaxID=3161017 RepID=UPI003424E584